MSNFRLQNYSLSSTSADQRDGFGKACAKNISAQDILLGHIQAERLTYTKLGHLKKPVRAKALLPQLLTSLLLVPGYASFANAQDAGALQRGLELQLKRSVPTPQIEKAKPTEVRKITPSDQKIVVKGFKFSGNTLVSEEQLQELIKSWINTEITFGDLKDATTSIQDFYAKKNRIALVTIPPQEVKDGIVLINVLEGKLGSVFIEPADPKSSLRFSPEIAKLYFVVKPDGTQFIDTKPLNQGLILLNELPGVIASGSFEPGDQTQQTNFRVKLSDGPLFNGQAALSNYGSASTGPGQAIANLSLNDPMGIGDQAKLDAIQSLGSSYAQLAYSLPVGRNGWRAGLSGSYLTYKTLSSFSSNQTEGTANTIGANTTYALLREPTKNMNLRFGVESRNYSNNQLSVNISEYQITALNASFSGDLADSLSSILNYGLVATVGHLNINNASQASQDSTGPSTAGGYRKLGFNISRNQDLSFLPNTNWLVSAYGQIANKNLNSSEQIYMGGPYAVRAYPVAQGGGSQGAILTTELQHRLNQSWQVGGFVDAGWVQQYVSTYSNWQGLTNANNGYKLTSTGLTTNYTYDRLLVNAALAFRVGQNPLYNSTGQQLNNDNAYKKMQGWIRASFSF